MSDARQLVDALIEKRSDRRVAYEDALDSGHMLFPDFTRALADEQAIRDRLATAPADERLALLDTRVPLLLLPVRLETRFTGRGTKQSLKIRVYPDQIHIQDVEPRLTEAEWQAGLAYWRHVSAQRQVEGWLETIVGSTRAEIVRAATKFDPESAPEPERPRLRPSNWARPATARLLPDSFRVQVSFDGGHHSFDFPRGVPEALPVTPSEADEKLTLAPAGLEALWSGTAAATPGLSIGWMFDFGAALACGMATELSQSDVPDLFAHLAQGGRMNVNVFGVQVSERPDDAARQVEEAFHALRSVGRLSSMAQGESTQSEGHRPKPPQDLPPKTEGAPLSRALGLKTAALHAADAQGSSEDHDAAAMAHLAWRFGFGAFSRDVLGIAEDEEWHAARRFVSGQVRARGTLPILRCGRQPYGILPIDPTPQADLRTGTAFEALVAKALPTLEPFWQNAARTVPQIAVDQRQDAEVLREVLAHDAHLTGLFGWLGLQIAPQSQPSPVGDLLDQLAVPEAAHAKAAHWVTVTDDILDVAAPAPFVRYSAPPLRNFSADWSVETMLSEDALTFDTLVETVGKDRYPVQAWREYPEILDISPGAAASMSTSALLDTRSDPPDTVFQTLLRTSLFDLFQSLAKAFLEAEGQAVPPVAGIDQSNGGRTFPRVEACIDGPLQGEAERLRLPLDPSDAQRLPKELVQDADDLLAAARRMAALSASPDGRKRLELLLKESLSLLTYRLDPWITGLAQARLDRLRDRTPLGLHIGAWSVVEGLQPDSTAGRSTEFIHAPSLPQASTAAILRSGQLARRAETGQSESYAMHLPSDKLRAARDILDGVSAGRPLSSILGFRLERDLRKNSGLLGGDRAALTDRLREIAPPPSARAEASEPATAAAPAPNDTCDGLELLRRFREDASALLAQTGLGTQHTQALSAALTRQQSEVDAISDLLLAEGVHQLASGNPERAGASLDALSRGESPPDRFDVVDTHRPGVGLEVRLLTLATPKTMGHLTEPPSAKDYGSALGRAAGPLAQWSETAVSGLMDLSLPVTLKHDGTVIWSGGVTPAALGLEPIHLLLPEMHLRRLITSLAKDHATSKAGDFADGDEIETDWEASDLNAALIGLASVRQGLSVGRGLEPEDLDASETPVGVHVDHEDLAARSATSVYLLGHALHSLRIAVGPAPMADELSALGGATLDAVPGTEGVVLPQGADPLTFVASPLDLKNAALLARLWALRGGLGNRERQAVMDALRALAFMAVPEALVDDGDTVEAVVMRASAAARRRWTEISAMTDPLSRMEAVFAFGVPLPKTLLLTSDAGLSKGTATTTAPEMARWLEDIGAVRRPCGDFHDGLCALEVLTHQTHVALTGAQLPADDKMPWLGLTAPEPADSARVAFAIHGALSASRTGGILIDSWAELIPDARATTGMALQSAKPQAQAPQVALLALPPEEGTPWTSDRLFASVARSMELTGMRGVRPKDLSDPALPLPLLQLGTGSMR